MFKKLFTVLLGGLVFFSPQTPDSLTVTAQSQGPGTIQITEPAGSAGTIQIEPGTPVSLQLEAGENAYISQVLINGQPDDTCIRQTEGTIRLTPRQDTLIQASFTKNPDTFPATTNLLKLTPSQSEALEQYARGDYASAYELRQEKIAQYGLEKDVDADGFLTMDFINAHGTDCTSGDGLIIINPLARQTAALYQQPQRAQGTINGYETHIWNFPGGYMNAALWQTSLAGFGDVAAFCANGYAAPPMPGTPVESVSLSEDSSLRKALYYGYNGPDNRMGNYGWSQATQVCITSDLVSYAVTGNCITKNLSQNLWNNYTLRFWNDMKNWPDPGPAFQAYIGHTSGSGTNWQGTPAAVQPIAFGRHTDKGSLQLIKKSEDPDVGKEDPAYTLKGAQYTIYDQKNQAVKTLTINAEGKSEVITLDFGTYTCKETKAPAGYLLDETVYTFTISAAQPDAQGHLNMHQVTVTDTPAYARAGLLIMKQDDTNQPLAGAHFAVRHYQKSARTPSRSWILKSDAQGKVMLDDAHKVSGDPFYTNGKGDIILPMGKLEIEETKAPAGFEPANETWTIDLAHDGTSDPIVYKPVTITNQPRQLVLTKKQTGTQMVIGNTEFIHEGPDGKTETLVTDEKGQLTIRPLKDGTHTLTETKPVPGYAPMEPVTFTITDGVADLKDTTLYNTPEDMKLVLIKTDPSNRPLSGAVFGLYEDEACDTLLTKLVTDEKGTLIFEDLKDRKTYWLKELQAPDGYRLPENAVVSFRLESDPVNDTGRLILNDKVYEAGHKDAAVGVEMNEGILTCALHRINHAESQLPETGSPTLWLVPGGLAAVIVVYEWRKRHEKRK